MVNVRHASGYAPDDGGGGGGVVVAVNDDQDRHNHSEQYASRNERVRSGTA